MSIRSKLWWLALAITGAAAFACAWHRAFVTAALLCAAIAFLAWKLRQRVPKFENLNDWFFALEGKDPFNPDVVPAYEFEGFVTVFVAAIRVKNHPTLTGETLFVFRDEIAQDQWRALVTRIRHGPHAIAAAPNSAKSMFE